MKNEKGITLLSLMVTVLVIIILMGISINYIIGDNSLILQAKSSAISQRFSTYEDELNASKMNSDIGDVLSEYDTNYENTERITGIIKEYQEMKKFIPSLIEEDAKYIRIVGNDLVLIGNDAIISEIAQNTNLEVYETEEELSYKYEMYLVEQYAKKVGSVGIEMPGLQNLSKEIAGKIYSDGWNYVTAEDISSNGILNGMPLNHAPYIIKPGRNYVQSIAGDDYKGIWTYSFNYKGDDDEIVLSSMLTAIDNTSIRNENSWGGFKFYTDTSHNYILPPTYNSSTGSLQLKETDRVENNNTIQEYTKIPYQEVDQRLALNEKYSICVTVKGTIMQCGSTTGVVSNSIVALSDQGGKYVTWIGMCNGFLHVYTFSTYNYSKLLEHKDMEVLNGENGDGFASIRLDNNLDNEYINIQVVAERGENSDIYINGEHKLTFKSGNEIFSYDVVTIGDLRRGRGLRYDGEIYNFALYGKLLSEEEVRHNWEYTRNQLGL